MNGILNSFRVRITSQLWPERPQIVIQPYVIHVWPSDKKTLFLDIFFLITLGRLKTWKEMPFPDLWLRPPSNKSPSRTYQSRPVIYCWLTLWKWWQYGDLLVEFTWFFCPVFFTLAENKCCVNLLGSTCEFNVDSLWVIGRRLFCLWGAVRCSWPFRACQPVLCGCSFTLCLAVLLTLLWFWRVCAMWLVSILPHFCDNWCICKWYSPSCISSMISRHDALHTHLRWSEIALCAPVVVFHAPTEVVFFFGRLVRS